MKLYSDPQQIVALAGASLLLVELTERSFVKLSRVRSASLHNAAGAELDAPPQSHLSISAVRGVTPSSAVGPKNR
jgi:hypothetical protein